MAMSSNGFSGVGATSFKRTAAEAAAHARIAFDEKQTLAGSMKKRPPAAYPIGGIDPAVKA